jgi:hypothetical protein
MRVVFYFILIFGFIESSFAQEVVVQQVDGNVEFVVGEKRTVVKDFSSFSEKSGVFILKDKNSQLFIRIGDKLDVLDFSEEKYQYPLKELIAPKQDLGKKEEGFLDKFFNIFSISHDDDAKINGMMVADKSGVSRSFNDTNIIFIETINIMGGHPLKIDFSSSIDSDKIGNNQFNVLVKNKYSDRIIFEQTITETYFTINDTANNSLSLNWDIEINNINSSKKIKGTVKSLYINPEKRKLFNQLKDKAISESKTDESTYQIVFIESLRSSGLLANACYYLDLFIETNNNPKLISYKDHYTK